MSMMLQYLSDHDTNTVVMEYDYTTVPYSVQLGTVTGVDACPIKEPGAFEAVESRWMEMLEKISSRPGNVALSRAYIPIGDTTMMFIAQMELPSLTDAHPVPNFGELFEVRQPLLGV